MENKKKMGYVRFIAEHIFWGALIWLFYINTVFRPLDSRTDFNSRFVRMKTKPSSQSLLIFALASGYIR